MKRAVAGLMIVLLISAADVARAEKAAEISRVLRPGQLPTDARLETPRNLRDKFHPWTPPTTKEAWAREADAIRKQLLVSTGLWPMPPRPGGGAVIHGKIDRGDYTVEKVFLPSAPGHYVTGNLYRPKNKTGRLPAVLSPHGHWRDGRFYDAGEDGAKQQIAGGGESLMSAARYPLQARMVGLARLGCVVFHYDMVGNADSKQIGHTEGFRDVDALLRLQNFMGLQTYNSLCALDFLASLPDVDDSRIGVSGSSGGGTQTFMLCAIDPRPLAAFPAVMVSTNMQGGCICENASYLRLGINNVAIAALFAPRPLAMTGADDWTIDIETKGLPELKQIYSLYGKPENVDAKAFPQFGHNYNQVARERMYAWFNEHLNIGHASPYKERDFEPIPPQELSVFDDAHQLPAGATDAASLRAAVTAYQQRAFDQLLPKSQPDVERYKETVGAAARVMLDRGVPDAAGLERVDRDTVSSSGFDVYKLVVGRAGAKEQVPLIALVSPDFTGDAVLWVHPDGKAGLFTDDGEPRSAVQELLDAGYAVVTADLFLTGEFVPEGEKPKYPALDEKYAGYTVAYNRSVLANRVRDILTVIGTMVEDENINTIHLIGTGEAGPWALLARGLAGNAVAKTVVDANGFGFEKIKSIDDPMLLPGALKYGGLGGLAALAAPGELIVAGTKEVPPNELKPLQAVYDAAQGNLTLIDETLSMDRAAELLIRK